MQVGPYWVVGEIARGGMGAVYRAQGASGEQVALKLLLAQRASDPRARRRFQAEVQALGRLRHPSVVSILGAGEHEGTPWLALEFVEGESLQARLRSGPLPIWEAIRIVQQLAQALSYVHACGILHRDLKPANVLLRGNQALLTDFGLVLDDQASVSRITATGIFQGTPGYWSPEQARGRKAEIGPATDLYGLGGVLYACLTGRPPVQAQSLQAYLEEIAFQSTQPPHRLRGDVPAWLSRLCMRCLALEPAQRPRSADEVARALVLAEGAAGGGRGARAGVAAAALAGVLGVAGLAWGGWWALSGEGGERSEVVATSDVDPLVSEQQREQAAALVELGHVYYDEQRYEEALREYDRALELGLPATIAKQIRHLRAKVAAKLEESSSGNAEAERLVTQGLEKFTAGRMLEAIGDFDRALELDPDHDGAYVSRGAAYVKLGRDAQALADLERALELNPDHGNAYVNRGAIWLRQGRVAEAVKDLDRALELDPQNAMGYLNRGSARSTLAQYPQAIEDYDRALALDPRNLAAVRNRGLSKAKLGRHGEAIADLDRALELAPGTVSILSERGFSKSELGREVEAIEDYTRALELESQHTLTLTRRGVSLAKLERLEEAIADYDLALRLNPSMPNAYVARGGCKANLGRHEDALEDYARAIELNPRSFLPYFNRAQSLAALGRHDQAIEDLDWVVKLGLKPEVEAEARALRAKFAAESRE